ncbi:hypothetical protein HYZ99_00920 [Candidatus Peregrinibacteria bacterium]|nr:hypothetical protein [Candidatus Peregrinibacteria bacterium]
MSSLEIHTLLKRPTVWILLALFLGSVATMTVPMETDLLGRVMNPAKKLAVPWRTFEAAEVSSGVTIPAHSHVIFHLPLNIKRITRKVLLGRDGDKIKYWGYCFPEDYDPKNPVHTAGFPGKLFLSEAERARREAERLSKFPKYSIYRPPTAKELRAIESGSNSMIRHQVEIFYGGMTCYIMTDQPLPLGTDTDNDFLNSYLEGDRRTDPFNADTDGDGVPDGTEVQAGFDPLRRDSDNDGLIDGIEDKNRNGRIDKGESDPRKRDSDADGLCDGYCRIIKGGRICSEFTTTKDCIPGIKVQWRGEDKNLNGLVDESETSPISPDTDGDGITDEQEYFNCLLAKKTDC